jgi:hypothetical protein
VNFTSRESHGPTQLVKLLRRNAESFDNSEVGVFSKEPRTLTETKTKQTENKTNATLTLKTPCN